MSRSDKGNAYIIRRFPTDLKRAVKIKAAEDDTTLRAIILAALEQYLNTKSERD